MGPGPDSAREHASYVILETAWNSDGRDALSHLWGVDPWFALLCPLHHPMLLDAIFG